MLLSVRMIFCSGENVFTYKCGFRTVGIDVLSESFFTERLIINTSNDIDTGLDKTVGHSAGATEKINCYYCAWLLHAIYRL